MDFRLSEDQLMFKRMFADFCTKEIRPQGEQIDQAEEPPTALLDKAVDQGFWAALVPEELEGCGLDAYTYMLMLEELARADMSTALILSVHNSLVLKPLLDHGTEDQRERYVEAMAFGEALSGVGAFPATTTADMPRIKMRAAPAPAARSSCLFCIVESSCSGKRSDQLFRFYDLVFFHINAGHLAVAWSNNRSFHLHGLEND